MFRLFEMLPEELTLKIVRESKLADQVTLARVSKFFNRFTHDPTVELFKLNNKIVKRVIGDITLMIRPQLSKNTYSMFLKRKQQKAEIHFHLIHNEEEYLQFKTLLGNDDIKTIINKFKSMGKQGSVISMLIEGEIKKIETINTPRIS